MHSEGNIPSGAQEKGEGKSPYVLPLEGYAVHSTRPSRRKSKEAAKNDRKLQALQEEHFEGLKAELKGVPPSSSISKSDHQISAKSTEDSEPDSEQIVKDKYELELLTMPKRKRGLLEAIMIGKKRKQENVKVLKDRKRKKSRDC